MRELIIYDEVNENTKINSLKTNEIINWNRSNRSNLNSILTFIEKNDEYYKEKYLTFIRNLKKSYFLSKPLINNYVIYENFSLWEMSLFEEKSFYKTPDINELIKILALKDIVKKNKVKKIIIYSANKKLASNILSLIEKIEIQTYNLKEYEPKNIYFLRNNFLFFFYFLLNFFIKRFKINNYSKKLKKNSILIFDYFAYFEKENALKGKFVSSYWKNFLLRIKKLKIRLNFLHVTLDEKNFFLNKKINILKSLNNSNVTSHNILDTSIDFDILRNVTFIFFKNYFKYLLFKILYKEHLIFKNNVLHKMFVDSFVGVWSIKNLFFFFMFKKFIKDHCKDNKVTIYLNEFQGWEKSMIFSLRKFSNSLIFGLQFNPVRNWDLRLKPDINKKNKDLFPDEIIGFYKSTKDQLSKNLSSCKKIKILISENLKPLSINPKAKKNNKILLVGDHDDISTISLLNTVNNLTKNKKDYKFEYKPHPISKIKLSKFKNLSGIKVYNDNSCFKKRYSAYIVSNKTSLGLELLDEKFKTGIILDKDTLNLSPVEKNYRFFISNEFELKNFINAKNHYSSGKKKFKRISWRVIMNSWKKKLQ